MKKYHFQHSLNKRLNYVISSNQQSGQAMVEVIISLFVIAGLWIGINWLGKIQDLALNSVNISSYAAFTGSLGQNNADILKNSHELLSKQTYQWRNHDANLTLKNSYQDLTINWQRSNDAPDTVQIGMSNIHAKQLRRQWLSDDTGILSAIARLTPIQREKDLTTNKNSLNFFLHNFPEITKHTSIATGNAYSNSDKDAANRVALSTYGWSDATNNSYSLGQRIDSVSSAIDAAWSRPRPQFDWLDPWGHLLPEHLVKSDKNKDLNWQSPQSFTPNGVNINVAVFDSELSPVNAANLINQQYPVFQKILTMPDRVVLSGVHENLHWLADINSHQTGSAGYVSSLTSLDTNLE